MKIICANSVTLGQEAFSPLGELEWLSESDINADSARDADAIVTRSKTRLNADLLGKSTVRFAGTCTAGIDHANLEELAALGIHFASAPGCNANAVSEYVLAALLEAPGFSFAGKTIGIIGHGQVGTRVEQKCKALGCNVLLNDPPKAAIVGAGPYVDLDHLLQESDVVTLHVPLIEAGPHPTRGLVGKSEIGQLKKGAIVINACRGEAVDNEALRDARLSGQVSWLVLDVWDPEPEIPQDLLEAADVATPHIAGHSVEGKVNGTRQIREQLLLHFDLDLPAWNPKPLMPPPEHGQVDISMEAGFELRLKKAVKACYDIRRDDQQLRESGGAAAQRFVSLRRNYRDRREFSATTLTGGGADENRMFVELGFQV